MDRRQMLARAADTERLRSAWYRDWQRRLPGCDPARAAELLAPVGCLRQAIVFQGFLDGLGAVLGAGDELRPLLELIPVAALADVVFLDQAFGDDDVGQGVQQGDVGRRTQGPYASSSSA